MNMTEFIVSSRHVLILLVFRRCLVLSTSPRQQFSFLKQSKLSLVSSFYSRNAVSIIYTVSRQLYTHFIGIENSLKKNHFNFPLRFPFACSDECNRSRCDQETRWLLQGSLPPSPSSLSLSHSLPLQMSVPAVLYVVQNNLLFLALSKLDAATYQVWRREGRWIGEYCILWEDIEAHVKWDGIA